MKSTILLSIFSVSGVKAATTFSGMWESTNYSLAFRSPAVNKIRGRRRWCERKDITVSCEGVSWVHTDRHFEGVHRNGLDSSKCNEHTRRSILRNGMFHIGWLIGAKNEVIPDAALAAEERDAKKPYAPLENLLPATRVKVLIDKAVDKANALVQLKENSFSADKMTEEKALLSQLEALLLAPQEYMSEKEVAAAKKYLEVNTLDGWTRARQKDTQQKFQIEIDPATRGQEAFEQWGERRQFKRLRRQQLALERSNSMRAAFNAYTNNLIFGDSYTVTASKEERSRLIRTYDQLPDVTSVVRSDLDLRDLYRNQVLTYMDDAKAELEYQSKSVEPFDATELLAILKEAQTSCLEWFKFIPEKDVKEALSVVLSERTPTN